MGTASHGLPVPVEVDEATGGWSVNGQPMVLVPRHFLVYMQMAFENEMGLEATMRAIESGTYRAARTWCEREAERGGLKGVEILQHYLDQVRKRGLGRYEILSADTGTGEAEIRLYGSVYAAEYGPETARKTCYMSAASCRGGMEVVLESLGKTVDLRCEETACASEGHEFCSFHVRPAQE